ncbi:MAG: amidohydrolase family protein, partial [Chloroflexi bacterium]|nr:amidohydrolase family protein [Chloroflexota bacterium]
VERAVAAATSIPARALGLEREVGAIEAGGQADLVVVDGDPATDPDALTRVRHVLQGGRRVVKDGRLVGA